MFNNINEYGIQVVEKIQFLIRFILKEQSDESLQNVCPEEKMLRFFALQAERQW